MEINLIIDSEAAGRRLDQVVSQHVTDCSRSRAADLIRRGHIQVSHHRKRPSYRVKGGERVTGTVLDSPDHLSLRPESGPVCIIHEDPHILVLEKPPGLVVHPGAGNRSGTLVNRLVRYCPGIGQVGEDPLRPGIVHRLDKDTSGVMVVAKTGSALTSLQAAFQRHQVEKHYLALVSGIDLPRTGEVDLPIGRHPVLRTRMAVIPETGREARTSWCVCRRFDHASLVRVRLHTGRTHQIRVHMHHLGHPLLGDRVYQHRRCRKQPHAFPRQMLHASDIAFCHPGTGVPVRFHSPLPPDFHAALQSI